MVKPKTAPAATGPLYPLPALQEQKRATPRPPQDHPKQSLGKQVQGGSVPFLLTALLPFLLSPWGCQLGPRAGFSSLLTPDREAFPGEGREQAGLPSWQGGGVILLSPASPKVGLYEEREKGGGERLRGRALPASFQRASGRLA